MKISVCMATYNGEKYIKEQLASILPQLQENDEVIISDDSSTDKTTEIIESFNDKRIILIKYQKFKSPIFNFENSLKKATGDVIFLSDQDDVWMNNKVAILLKYLNDFDLILSDAFVVDENLNVISDSFYSINGSKKGLLKNIIKNSYLGCTMAFNRKILNKSLPFPKTIPMHDWWLGLIGEKYGKTFFVKEKLIKYRRHGENASPTGEKSTYNFINKLNFRIKIIKCLFFKIK